MKLTRLAAPVLAIGLIVVPALYAASGLSDRDQRRLDRAKEIHAAEIERAAADFLKRVERANTVLEKSYEPIIKSYDGRDAATAERLKAELAEVCAKASSLLTIEIPKHVELMGAIGDSLVNGQGEAVPTASLGKRDYVVLYYTAAWCGPCKTFTPRLVSFYNEKQERGNFEVVVVSSDRSLQEFSGYIAQMPWVAVPFECRDSCGLKQQHGGRGIPHLVILDGDGKVLSSSYEGTRYVGPNKVLADLDALIAAKGQ